MYGIVALRTFSDPNMVRKVGESYLAPFKDIGIKTHRTILRYGVIETGYNMKILCNSRIFISGYISIVVQIYSKYID